MKKHAMKILTAAAILAAAFVYHHRTTTPACPTNPACPPPPVKPAVKPVLNDPMAVTPLQPKQPTPPKPELKPKPVIQQQPTPQPIAPEVAPTQEENYPTQAELEKQRAALYWQYATQHFNQQIAMLNAENNPTQRMDLIQAIARNVRVDTLRTIDWAMGLEDPEEKRVALEAINQNALVGIGAKIQTDETGLPRILDTTILSAVGSSGEVQPGDYISGIVTSDGSFIDFKDRPIHEVVQMLRGQPGTEVRLLMKRIPDNDQTEPHSYNLPVLRSMIIIQPPL